MDNCCTLRFVGPSSQRDSARAALEALGFAEVEGSMPWREAFPQWDAEQLPGVCLVGARQKEGMTQVQLAQRTGIPQRHLSEMERGKRQIGKKLAKTLALALNVDYRIFL